MRKIFLSNRAVEAELQDSVQIGPEGLSLAFQSAPIATNLLAWIQQQKRPDGWYASFSKPAPIGREDVALTIDQGWVLLALSAAGEEAMVRDLADAVLASGHALPRKAGGTDVDPVASTWFMLASSLTVAGLPLGAIALASDLLAKQSHEGLVTAVSGATATSVVENLLAYALFREIGHLEAATRIRIALEEQDAFGLPFLGAEGLSLESLVMSAFMRQDREVLRRAERDLYDSRAGGCRWETHWRRTSPHAAAFLSLAEDELGFAGGRASTLRSQAISSLIGGVQPPVDLLGSDYVERESQLAYAAILYLSIVGKRGISELWN